MPCLTLISKKIIFALFLCIYPKGENCPKASTLFILAKLLASLPQTIKEYIGCFVLKKSFLFCKIQFEIAPVEPFEFFISNTFPLLNSQEKIGNKIVPLFPTSSCKLSIKVFSW